MRQASARSCLCSLSLWPLRNQTLVCATIDPMQSVIWNPGLELCLQLRQHRRNSKISSMLDNKLFLLNVHEREFESLKRWNEYSNWIDAKFARNKWRNSKSYQILKVFLRLFTFSLFSERFTFNSISQFEFKILTSYVYQNTAQKGLCDNFKKTIFLLSSGFPWFEIIVQNFIVIFLFVVNVWQYD